MTRFAQTHCSQCGKEFGPRDSGFSHCDDHKYKIDDEYISARGLIRKAAGHDEAFRLECIKRTSVAAGILRRNGYAVDEV